MRSFIHNLCYSGLCGPHFNVIACLSKSTINTSLDKMIVSLLLLSFKKSLPSISIKDQLSLYHTSLCLTKLYLLIFLCLLRCTTKLLQFPPAWVIWRSLGKSQQLIISSLVKWMRLDEQASFSKMKWKCSHGYSSVKLTSQPISQRCLSVTACWSRLGLQH